MTFTNTMYKITDLGSLMLSLLLKLILVTLIKIGYTILKKPDPAGFLFTCTLYMQSYVKTFNIGWGTDSLITAFQNFFYSHFIFASYTPGTLFITESILNSKFYLFDYTCNFVQTINQKAKFFTSKYIIFGKNNAVIYSCPLFFSADVHIFYSWFLTALIKANKCLWIAFLTCMLKLYQQCRH